MKERKKYKRDLKFPDLLTKGVKLRQQGLTYKVIAYRFGCSRDWAQRVISREIKKQNAQMASVEETKT